MTEKEAVSKQETESGKAKSLFVEKLDIDEEVAEMLVSEGFTNLEEIAYVPVQELAEVEGFDENIASELQQRASDVLLTQELATETARRVTNPDEDLLSVEGMTEKLALKLAEKGVINREDLAEHSVGELTDLVNELDEKTAAKLIMSARAHWFE